MIGSAAGNTKRGGHELRPPGPRDARAGPPVTAHLAALVGLALVDSVNPTSLTLMFLLLVRSRGTGRGWAFLAGVLATYLLVGLVLLGGLDLLIHEESADWSQSGAAYGVQFGLGALLVVLGLRGGTVDEAREEEEAERNTSLVESGMLGAMGTIADLPTALPYAAAIHLILTSRAADAVQYGMLVLYNLVCILPLLGLLVLRILMRERLERLTVRLPDLEARVEKVSRVLLLLLGSVLGLDSLGWWLTGSALLP